MCKFVEAAVGRDTCLVRIILFRLALIRVTLISRSAPFAPECFVSSLNSFCRNSYCLDFLRFLFRLVLLRAVLKGLIFLNYNL